MMSSQELVTKWGAGELSESEYKDLLAEARTVIKEMTGLQFRLGDIGLKIDPPTDEPRERSGQFHRFADDVGMKYETLAGYRRVAAAWPAEHRAPEKASYAVHRMLALLGDRFERIQHPRDGAEVWTYDNAAREMDRHPTWPVTPEERVEKIHDLATDDDVATEIARDLLKRPAVISRVVEDNVTRHLLDQARVRHGQNQARKVEAERAEKYPAMQQMASHMECVEILGSCASFVAAIHRLLPHVLDEGLAAADRQAVAASLRRVSQAAEWGVTAVETGSDGLDQRLAQLLDEGTGS